MPDTKTTVSETCVVNVSSFPAPRSLRPYVADFILSEVQVEDGEKVEDFLFPDLATLRFSQNLIGEAQTRSGWRMGGRDFAVVGPLVHDVRFATSSHRQWIVRLQPVGWSRLVGVAASEYANRFVDGMVDPAFARFRSIGRGLYVDNRSPEAELAHLVSRLESLALLPDISFQTIVAAQEALDDASIETVEAMAVRVGTSRRRLERLCLRSFGFPPKILLRRARFLRSLVNFSGDPSLRWMAAIDPAYHDQAHFVRDFKDFMGVTPSEYAQQSRPISNAVLRDRAMARVKRS